jgi:glutamate-1-semialdehyde 2,1-aminomutase
MSDANSQKLFKRACQVMPGGVNSPVRAFRAVGGEPVFIREAKGAWLTGADGQKYVDYVGSWGPMIVGHAHPKVISAVKTAATRGTSYGAPTEGEIDLAAAVIEAYPSMEMVRMTSSGTEAVMGAVRAARGYTGRDLVVKFEGCYHGGADYLLVKAGSGAATFGEPDSAGVPSAIASTTAVVPFNDVEALKALFNARGAEIAAVIVEPVVGNMGCVPPAPGFLQELQELCHGAGSLLILDEVMTGFRLAYGGAQAIFDLRPDLTVLGKIVGGGLPVGVYGGRREIMERVAPLGPVYQAGTLSGNPLAVAAGLATLKLLRSPKVYERLEALGAELEQILVESARAAKVAVTVQRAGSMLTVFFTDRPVKTWADAASCDREKFAIWHQSLLAGGVYWPPSQFEAAFLSLEHDASTMSLTEKSALAAFRSI